MGKVGSQSQKTIEENGMFSICVPVVMFIIDAYPVGRISGLDEEGERPPAFGQKIR